MKRNMWNKIVAIGMVFGMLTASMPVLAFEDEMIVADDSYFVIEDDTEAIVEPEYNESYKDIFDAPLIVEENGAEVAGETPPDGATDETEAELYAAEDADIPIDEAHFPDEKFREKISSKEYDKNEDGVFSADEINSITALNVSSEPSISSVDGVEYFTNLESFFCSNCELTSLDVSKNTALRCLECSSNQLTSLDVSKNTVLQYLLCMRNQLTSLDVSKNTALKDLYCDTNRLTSLDVSKNTVLTVLSCSVNKLTSLDVSNNKDLQRLFCTFNQLTSLDIRNCPNLEYDYYYGSCSDVDSYLVYNVTVEVSGVNVTYYLEFDKPVTILVNDIEAPDDPIIVVSLGDSYSSGEGIEPFYGQDLPSSVKFDDRDWLAHRSQKSWPGMLKIPGVEKTMKYYKYDPNLTTESLKKEDCIWFFRAVSGAETKHFSKVKQKKTVRQFERFLKEEEKFLPLQFNVFDEIRNRDLGTVDYVTLTVGGNDVGFVDIITTCAMKSTYLGSKTLETQLDTLWANIDTTMNNIRDVYYGIHDRTSPETIIIVAGYPKLLEVNGKGGAISRKEATLVNQKVSAFNSKIWELVNECSSDMNIYYADIETEFGTTHQAYSDENWINEIYLGPEEQDLDHLSKASSYSMHPNETGAEHYAKVVNKVIKDMAGSGN